MNMQALASVAMQSAHSVAVASPHPAPTTQAHPGLGTAAPGHGVPTALDKLWLFQQRLDLAKQVDQQLPYFAHSISVSVIGGPKANMQRIWALCLSTAFGRYRQAGLQGFQAGSLDAVWDITGKSCQVVVGYVNSGGIGLALAARAIVLNKLRSTLPQHVIGDRFEATNTMSEFLLSGPSQETVGGDMLSWLRADAVLLSAAAGGGAGAGLGGIIGGQSGARIGGFIGALIGAAAGSQAAKEARAGTVALPDTHRVITTANKTNRNLQPPKPSGDGFSRTFPYIALVANALTEPCYLPAGPPSPPAFDPKPVVLFTGGTATREMINRSVNGLKVNLPVDADAAAGLLGGLAIGAATIDAATRTREDGYESLPKDIADIKGDTNRGN